jgi:hypothetical protein
VRRFNRKKGKRLLRPNNRRKKKYNVQRKNINLKKSKIDLDLAKKCLERGIIHIQNGWPRIGAFIGIVLGLKELGIIMAVIIVNTFYFFFIKFDKFHNK